MKKNIEHYIEIVWVFMQLSYEITVKGFCSFVIFIFLGITRVNLTPVNQLSLMRFLEKDTLKRVLFLQPMGSLSYAIQIIILESNSDVKGILMVNIYATFQLQFLKK